MVLYWGIPCTHTSSALSGDLQIYILTSIFLSTILFDFYYPASSCANFNKNPLACVTPPAKLPYGESLCGYSSSSGVCSLRPPPRSLSFLLAVALVTFSIMIPYNILFYTVLINVAASIPNLCFGSEMKSSSLISLWTELSSTTE